MSTKAYLRSMKAFLRRGSWMLIRACNTVTPPANEGGRLLLHLGCGPINAEGYTNVDVQAFPHVHYVHDVYPLEMLKSNSADLVYASHVLEHFPYAKLLDVLKEWRRVLKPGGILRLGVPDFGILANIYADTRVISNILGPLMGGQTDEHNFHYSVFDLQYLTDLLREAGFQEIRFWEPANVEDHSFQDTTSNVWNLLGKEYPISLNVEANK